MKNKTIHRIMGLLVMAALIVIFLPLLFLSGNAGEPKQKITPLPVTTVSEQKIPQAPPVTENASQPLLTIAPPLPQPELTISPSDVTSSDIVKIVDSDSPVISVADNQEKKMPTMVAKKPLIVKKNHVKKKSITPSRWAVQLGSFHLKSNATQLVMQLRKQGFSIFTREIKSASGQISTQVYAGPISQHTAALELEHKIAEKSQVKGFIVLLN